MSLIPAGKTRPQPGNYFRLSEFACKCGCGFCEPDERLRETLNIIREALGKPIIITSGCRCKKHNAEVGGVEKSSHTLGHAADIKSRAGARKLRNLIKELYIGGMLPELAGLGLYGTFCHVDIEPKAAGRLREW